MKQLSDEAFAVLARARSDTEFADTLLKDPDRALRPYECNSEDIEYLKSFRSKAEIEDSYDVWWRPRFSRNSVFLLTALVVLLIATYFLGNLFYPSAITSLGLPRLGDISEPARPIIVIYTVVILVFAVSLLIRALSGLNTPTRTVLLIAVVVFLFIPASVGITLLPETTQIILSRVLLILVFTVLPASLYSLFITTRGKTLWGEFDYNLTRLDPVRYRNLIPIYRKKFEAMYGPPEQSGFNSALLRGEASFPVLLNTVIVGLGWIMFFSLSSTFVHVRVFWEGGVSPFTFGFLGAYLFSLEMLFRRYVQSDLKSTAYTHSSQRILITWVWAIVLSVLPWQTIGVDSEMENEIISILAFAVGIFPDIAWQVISMIIKRVLAFPLPSLRQGHPLNQIEGITIWVEARLLEENIENVQNLITTGVFDLMLRTNLEPQRIINWIDQGVLELHLGPRKARLKQQDNTLRAAFHERGILTATDLLDTFKAFEQSSKAANGAKTFLNAKLDPLVVTLVQTIDNDPNMYYVKAWSGMSSNLNEKLPEAIEVRIYEETQAPSQTA